MVDSVQDFEIVFISDLDVSQAHPTWSPQAVEDYQAIKRNTVLLSGEIESVENGELYEPGIQTSSADELIEELEVDMAGMIHLLVERIEDLESSASANLEIEEPEDVYPSIPQEIEIVAITGDFTTTGSQIIICNNTVANTVTLNPNPDDGEQVHIKRMDAPVSVVGQVDGITPNDILYQYDSPHLVYTTDAGQWGLI